MKAFIAKIEKAAALPEEQVKEERGVGVFVLKYEAEPTTDHVVW